MSAADSYSSRFISIAEGGRQFLDRLLPLIPATGTPRLLDLGCGTGELMLQMLASRPGLSLVGLDISAPNIAEADRRATGQNCEFHCADYMQWHNGAFDVVTADSVLHLIATPIDQLAAKLAADLKPDGILVVTVPDGGAINQLHLALRRLWRLTPAVADRLALRIGKLVYPNFPSEALADRLPYLRILPRLFDDAVLAHFDRAGLERIACEALPSPSAAKLQHRFMVWRRRP